MSIKSLNFIDATNILHSGNIIYKSDREILLKAGFQAKEGSIFEAKISNIPCN